MEKNNNLDYSEHIAKNLQQYYSAKGSIGQNNRIYPGLEWITEYAENHSTSGNSKLPILDIEFYPCENLDILQNANFGTYTGEILNAKGFNEFTVDSLADTKVILSYLNCFDIVILSETTIEQSQKEMLQYYVKGGGNLIAF